MQNEMTDGDKRQRQARAEMRAVMGKQANVQIGETAGGGGAHYRRKDEDNSRLAAGESSLVERSSWS